MLFVHIIAIVVLVVDGRPSNEHGGGGGGAKHGDHDIAHYIKTELKLPGQRDRKETTLDREIWIPIKGSHDIADPNTLMDHVVATWDAFDDAGMVDPKQETSIANHREPLSMEEAWHHYQAGQNGILDSARYLITFGIIPSLQSGGTELHIAASMNQVERIRALLEDEELMLDVDTPKELDGSTPLHSACGMGHVEAATVLLEHGANVEAVGSNGVTPLQIAASMGHVHLVRLLAEHGANVNAQHGFAGTTALHFAAEMGNIEIIKLLCTELGADVELEKHPTGGTALHTAADTNQSDSVWALIEYCGADPSRLMMNDTTPLYLAAQRGFTKVCETLLGHGADIDFEMPRGSSSRTVVLSDLEEKSSDSRREWYQPKNVEIGNGATSLHAAVENGHLETVRLLLEHGAEQKPSMEGTTPLILALQYGHPEIALELLKHYPARVNVQLPRDGVHALFVASGGMNAVDVVRELIRPDRTEKVDVNLVTRHKHTALAHAASFGNVEILRLLISAGARNEASEPTALNIAISSRQTRASKVLLEHFSPAGQDQDGFTPLHAACSSGDVDLARELLDVIDANARIHSTGATPLMMAAKNGHVQVVRALIEDENVDVNRRALSHPLYGATALYLATQNHHVDVVKTLLRAGADSMVALEEINVTPLFIASERGYLDLVRLYLETDVKNAKQQLAITNWNGVNVFYIAALTGRTSVVKYLVENFINLIDLNAKDNQDLHVFRAILRQGNMKGTADVLTYLLSNAKTRLEFDLEVVLVDLLQVQQDKSRARSHKECLKLWDAFMNYREFKQVEIEPQVLTLAINAYQHYKDAKKADRDAAELVGRILQSSTTCSDGALENDSLVSAVKLERVQVVEKLLPLFAISEETAQAQLSRAKEVARAKRNFDLIKTLSTVSLD